MGTVKLAAALPKEPADNGLQDHSWQLLKSQRSDQFVLIMVVEVQQEISDRWKGTRVPVLGIAAVELIEDADADTAKRIMQRAHDKRYAREPLPLPGTLPFGADGLTQADQARYGAAGLLKRGSGVVTEVDIDPAELDGDG